jgi:hypothetical protein
MRSKLVLAALIFLSILPVYAQVAPAAKISGLPLGVGVGITDYDPSYYEYPVLVPGWNGRMIGVSVWGDYRIYRGFGVAVQATSLFGNKPATNPLPGQAVFGSLKEQTLQAGIIYRYHEVFKVRPFVQALAGEGRINFPSVNPFYTYEDSPLYSFGGGLEYRVWNNMFVRGQYEYQTWKGFQVNAQGQEKPLHPAGATLGVTYYLRGVRRRY